MDPDHRLPEFTLKAALLGAALSVLLAGANAYLGLKVGMTVSASIPAAVMSMAVLSLFRRSGILEHNLVQTAASAGESLAAGVIFTLPALILAGYWSDFRYGPTTAIALVGGLLGVLFSIPLRRVLIVESRLAFPEGVATAEVLRAGQEGGRGVRLMAGAGICAFVYKVAQSGLKLVGSRVTASFGVKKALFVSGCDLSPALLAVGYIVGINIAVLVFAGGVGAWLIGIPVYTALFGVPTAPDGSALGAYEAAGIVWSTKIRYAGVGAMFVGGVWAIAALVKPLSDGLRASLAARRAERRSVGTDAPHLDRDLPPRVILGGVAALVPALLLVFLAILRRGELGVAPARYAVVVLLALGLALIAGFLFSAVAGYMAGLVGSSNNPISGVTIATVLVTAILLFALLGNQPAGIAAVMLVAATVCCAAAISGDNLQDLKAGRLVGATPARQQVMQMIGVAAAAVTLAPILSLLYNAYGLGGVFPRAGMDAAESLAAPQATLMVSVARGVFARQLEWGMIGIGAAVAVAVILLDETLKARGSRFRVPVLAVAVGIYLPVELSTPIVIGGIVAHLTGGSRRNGLLFSSGLIAGEALAGIAMAIPFALFRSTSVLALAPEGWGAPGTVLGVALMAGIALWLGRAAAGSASSAEA
jgi:putative OPT family oligopeptide transporter